MVLGATVDVVVSGTTTAAFIVVVMIGTGVVVVVVVVDDGRTVVVEEGINRAVTISTVVGAGFNVVVVVVGGVLLADLVGTLGDSDAGNKSIFAVVTLTGVGGDVTATLAVVGSDGATVVDVIRRKSVIESPSVG